MTLNLRPFSLLFWRAKIYLVNWHEEVGMGWPPPTIWQKNPTCYRFSKRFVSLLMPLGNPQPLAASSLVCVRLYVVWIKIGGLDRQAGPNALLAFLNNKKMKFPFMWDELSSDKLNVQLDRSWHSIMHLSKQWWFCGKDNDVQCPMSNDKCPMSNVQCQMIQCPMSDVQCGKRAAQVMMSMSNVHPSI